MTKVSGPTSTTRRPVTAELVQFSPPQWLAHPIVTRADGGHVSRCRPGGRT